MYFTRKTKIKTQIKVQVKTLLFNKILIIVLLEYFNYSNIFLVKYKIEFFKLININNYSIKLEKSKKPFFGTIYSIRPIKLKI